MIRTKYTAPVLLSEEYKTIGGYIMVEFDKFKEMELLKTLKGNAGSPFNRHFAYIELQDFYYKYRNLDIKYLELCEKYCLKDIESIEDANQDYISQSISQITKYADIRDDRTNDLKEINKIKNTGFDGYIPAFKRLAIIEEKRGNYDKAINYCNIAINWYTKRKCKEYMEEFKKRKEKYISKRDKIS